MFLSRVHSVAALVITFASWGVMAAPNIQSLLRDIPTGLDLANAGARGVCEVREAQIALAGIGGSIRQGARAVGLPLYPDAAWVAKTPGGDNFVVSARYGQMNARAMYPSKLHVSIAGDDGTGFVAKTSRTLALDEVGAAIGGGLIPYSDGEVTAEVAGLEHRGRTLLPRAMGSLKLDPGAAIAPMQRGTVAIPVMHVRADGSVMAPQKPIILRITGLNQHIGFARAYFNEVPSELQGLRLNGRELTLKVQSRDYWEGEFTNGPRFVMETDPFGMPLELKIWSRQ